MLAASVVLLAACQPKERPVSPAEQAAIADSVTNQVDTLFAALNARSADRMYALYVPGEALVTADNGKLVASRDSMERADRAFWGSLKAAQFVEDGRKIQVLARNVVVYTSAWHGTMTDSTGKAMEMRGAWSGVWQRLPEGWKVVQQHGSMPVPMPAPQPARGRRG
jgi:ketosteroid isomerase-like protein